MPSHHRRIEAKMTELGYGPEEYASQSIKIERTHENFGKQLPLLQLVQLEARRPAEGPDRSQ